MFYMTCCIGDDLVLSENCIKELFNQYYERYSEMFDVNAYIRHLVSKEDCLEYQDFTSSIRTDDKEILEILSKHKVNGSISFVRMKGSHDADFFGYEFQDGQCSKIIGIPFWFDENNCQKE